MAAVNAAIHQLVSLPLEQTAYQKEIEMIKRICQINGLPQNIEHLVRQKQLRILLSENNPPPPPNSTGQKIRYARIPFLGPSSYKLASELRRFGYRAAFYPLCTLGNLSSLKDGTPTLKKSGIYEAHCELCNVFYYGQTGRTLRQRIMEHRNDYNKAMRILAGGNSSIEALSVESAVAEHCIHQNHGFENVVFKLIHQADKGRSLHRLEETSVLQAISNNKTVLNDLGTFINPFLSHYFQTSSPLVSHSHV